MAIETLSRKDAGEVATMRASGATDTAIRGVMLAKGRTPSQIDTYLALAAVKIKTERRGGNVALAETPTVAYGRLEKAKWTAMLTDISADIGRWTATVIRVLGTKL